jgi:hypothetical protein
VDSVRAVGLERVNARLALGLPCDALSPSRRVADQHRQLRSGLAIEPEEGNEADRLITLLEEDGPLAIAAGVDRPLDPAPRVLRGEGIAPADEIPRHALVVEPALNRGSILGAEVAQGDVRGHPLA